MIYFLFVPHFPPSPLGEGLGVKQGFRQVYLPPAERLPDAPGNAHCK